MRSLIGRSATGPFTGAEIAIITGPVLLASLLHSINMATAYVALPNIQGNLSARPDQIGWVVTAFVVASGVGTVLTGWLAAKFGRRRFFLASIVIFTITSGLCGIATSLDELVFMRILQGIASGPLLPISQAVILDTWPRSRHGFAIGIWSVGMIMGPILGPTIGAFLTEIYDWRWIFFINIPLGIAAFVGLMVTLPEVRIRAQKLDSLGLVSLIVGVCCLQLMIDRGEQEDWFNSTEIIIEAVITGLAFYLFIVHCFTAKRPYVDLRIFRDRNYVVGVSLIFMFGICVFSSLFVLPLFLQNVQDYPVLSTGWLVSTRGLGTLVAMIITGILTDRLPPKYLIFTGIAIVVVSNVMMVGWNADVSAYTVTVVMLISGFGMGMMWVALTTVTFSTLPVSLRIEGTALFALIRAIGASMGTSVLVTILVRTSQINYIEMRGQITHYNSVISGPGALWDPSSVAGLLSLQQQVLAEAQTISYLNSFIFLLLVALASLPMVLLLRKPASTA